MQSSNDALMRYGASA